MPRLNYDTLLPTVGLKNPIFIVNALSFFFLTETPPGDCLLLTNGRTSPLVLILRP